MGGTEGLFVVYYRPLDCLRTHVLANFMGIFGASDELLVLLRTVTKGVYHQTAS